jgi:acetolactate synthase-1/2/3 large subunit
VNEEVTPMNATAARTGAVALLEFARTRNWVGQPISPTPDYAKLAEAYGGYGERVQSADALPAALDRARRALGEGRLALLDVITYP